MAVGCSGGGCGGGERGEEALGLGLVGDFFPRLLDEAHARVLLDGAGDAAGGGLLEAHRRVIGRVD